MLICPGQKIRILQKNVKKKNICFVQLISPTTSWSRAKKIIKDSHQMIYYISMLSTTGGKLKVKPKEILSNYNKLKKSIQVKTVLLVLVLRKNQLPN